MKFPRFPRHFFVLLGFALVLLCNAIATSQETAARSATASGLGDRLPQFASQGEVPLRTQASLVPMYEQAFREQISMERQALEREKTGGSGSALRNTLRLRLGLADSELVRPANTWETPERLPLARSIRSPKEGLAY